MHHIFIIVLVFFLLVAVWQDIRHFRIPNILILSGAVIGVLLNVSLPQDMGGLGAPSSFVGLGVGLVILLPFYMLRTMGAGDIKLMAMIGAFVGPSNILIITIYVLLAGGILSLSVSLLRGKFSTLINNLKFILFLRLAGTSTVSPITTETLHQSAGKVPYGAAIAAGTLFYLLTDYHIFG